MRSALILMGLCLFLAITAGCASKKIKGTKDPQRNRADSLLLAKKGDLTDEELRQLRKILEELQDVPFNFDSYSIPVQGLEIIKRDVRLLNMMLEKRHRYIRITLEGHCDERGSNEYNLALGERRANAVRDYLHTAGFSDNSLDVISYGEERPKIDESTEEAWAANRRVHLVVE